MKTKGLIILAGLTIVALATTSAILRTNPSRIVSDRRGEVVFPELASAGGDISLIDIQDGDRSFSERLIYETAIFRLANEYAIIFNISLDVAKEKVVAIAKDKITIEPKGKDFDLDFDNMVKSLHDDEEDDDNDEEEDDDDDDEHYKSLDKYSQEDDEDDFMEQFKKAEKNIKKDKKSTNKTAKKSKK
jgi:hypothetical protein